MAEDPKPKPPAGGGAVDGVKPNISPSPNEVAGKTAGGQPPDPNSRVQAEPLSDGTVPTVLNAGESHRSVAKGKTSITSIYRKADVMTTLITFVAAVVASGIVIGAYVFLNHSKKPTVTPGKTSTLSSSDLSKLGSFFQGNSAGTNAQILTISSSSLFKNRVAVDSDLKVTGGLSVGGSTAFGNITVDQVSTLGVTNVRGQLTVTGPVSLQSPATLSGGATVKGNLAVSGNGSFGGSVSAGVISVTTLTVTGTLNLNGHLSIGGQTPGVSAIPGVTTNASVDGNDSAGSVSVEVLPTGGNSNGAALVTIHFHSPYVSIPVIVIAPVGRNPALSQPYVVPGATSFNINASTIPALASATNYTFNYWVVQF
jgi:hypothetical protein